MSEHKDLSLAVLDTSDKDVIASVAASVKEQFEHFFTEFNDVQATGYSIQVTSETQTDLMKEAREKRLALKNLRVQIQKEAKELRDPYNATAKHIIAVEKELLAGFKTLEAHLQTQEDFAKVAEAKRTAEKVEARRKSLEMYMAPVQVRYLDLENMPDIVFESALKEAKEKYEKFQKLEMLENQKIEEQRKQEELGKPDIQVFAHGKVNELICVGTNIFADNLRALSVIQNTDEGKSYYFLPYYFQDIGNDQFKMHRLGQPLPEDLQRNIDRAKERAEELDNQSPKA